MMQCAPFSFHSCCRLIACNSLIFVLVSLSYAAPTFAGLVQYKLNSPLTSGGRVNQFSISADGQTVVYQASLNAVKVYELYSVPVNGGTVTKISGTMVAGGSVSSFLISPDNSTVIYIADQDTAGQRELYSVPIGGGTVTKLNDTIISGGNLDRAAISPDSSTVVYMADQNVLIKHRFSRVALR